MNLSFNRYLPCFCLWTLIQPTITEYKCEDFDTRNQIQACIYDIFKCKTEEVILPFQTTDFTNAITTHASTTEGMMQFSFYSCEALFL